jgi:hypothetical protein
LVASEPHDDLPGWHDVPDGYLLTANLTANPAIENRVTLEQL